MADLVFSDDDRRKVREAIAAAEARTSGEIFVVVARESDEYRSVPLLWATLVALLVPLPLIFLTLLPVIQIYLIQLAAFAVIATALSLPVLRGSIIPRRTKTVRAHRLAVDQFLAHGLHTTEARTGVLIFVSLMERYAEIIADAGIHGEVGQAAWDEIVASLLAEIRAGRLADGLVAAIGKAGDALASHFPPRAVNRDELPNDLVLL